ncbi:MAG: NAD(P)H-dependent oxidoreductase [Acidimicrobiaceae bacterium]|nr:NAD(P)H-dependent oxidoreductase [Acidimicrobiaceae bacterium]
MMASCRVLLVSGSLRAGSTNTAVLRTAVVVAPAGVEPDLYPDLGELPHFNPDDDVDPYPPAVSRMRQRLRAADAVLFSVPEYAGALPGSCKNLLDWTIGDDQPGSIYEKPVAWINASPRGAPGAHQELRMVLGYAHASIVEEACVDMPITGSMVAADGLIADPGVRTRIAGVLEAIADHVRRSRYP